MNDPRNENRFEGPVIFGPTSHNQFAWNNRAAVTQNQQENTAIAPGYEALAERVAELLRQLPEAGLSDQDREDAEAAAGEVLAEITGSTPPEQGRLRRVLATLRGALTPVAMGAAAGTTVATQEWARAAIEGLIV